MRIVVRNAMRVLFSGAVMFAGLAYGDLALDEGMWRLELNSDFGVHQGSRDRSGDFSVSGFVDYEVPATERATLGLRLMPLFIYDQNVDYDDHFLRDAFQDNDENSSTVWGVGIGVVGRIYQIKEEYRGWYGELGETVIVHNNQFAGNNSNLNFLTTLGVGYQFKNDWHLQVHYQHISNGSLGSRNSGANSLGLGVGYRF